MCIRDRLSVGKERYLSLLYCLLPCFLIISHVKRSIPAWYFYWAFVEFSHLLCISESSAGRCSLCSVQFLSLPWNLSIHNNISIVVGKMEYGQETPWYDFNLSIKICSVQAYRGVVWKQGWIDSCPSIVSCHHLIHLCKLSATGLMGISLLL